LTVNTSAKKTPSIQVIKSRIDSALTRLESSVEAKLSSAEQSSRQSQKLVAAEAEILLLREKHLVISTRLDIAIDRMKEIVEN
jgi:hypothetical protein